MFKERVEADPYGALTNWRELDRCSWFGVACSDDGRVVSLNLKDFCLKGTLTPELGKLIHLKSLILNNNKFYGTIPEEIGDLQKLQVMDLGYNNFSGPLPHDLERILSLQILVLRSSKLMSNLSPELHGLNVLSELMIDQEPIDSHMECPSRNKNYPMRKLLQTVDSLKGRPVRNRRHHRNHATSVRSPSPLVSPSPSPVNSSGHPGLSPSPSNVSPSPTPEQSPQMYPTPANAPSPSELPQKKQTVSWPIYTAVGGAVSFLLVLSAVYTFCCRVNKVVTVMPWSTGLSGQLQKAFVTGVPSLKRSELERACEDFSNVIGTLSDCMLYKGTLSNGVEIAVTSTMITLAKDWSAHYEVQFRKKISVMSKVNHKNFMSLLGYSEEEEPFTRMMVFEYAPNGTLFEHLHIREAEHLDWAMRIRIAMGIAYCLEYMHQLNPPVIIGNLNSSTVYLSDDYAAMVSDIVFWNYETETADESQGPSDVPLSDMESVVYKFGIILVELISGRRPFSEDDGLLVLYASSYLTGQRPLRDMVDPTLESFRDEDVIALCEVIQPCINPDPRERPTMTEIVRRLRQITTMAPDEAVPKLSPLWWAELEINSGDVS